MTVVVIGAVGFMLVASSEAAQVDHAAWDQLLHQHVHGRWVDYEGLARERAALDQYVKSLRDLDPKALGARGAQLAFWVNAYNATVMQAVLDHAPLKSVKDVRGFFDALRFLVGGKALTVNGIETQGRALGDWRIHFAVVCASWSCPPIRGEAYVAQRLDDQLSDQTREFLRDSARGLKVDGKTLWVSQIFKWYVTDFIPDGQLTAGRLVAVLQPYLDPEVVASITQQKPGLKLFDYDWSLNRVPMDRGAAAR